MCQTIVHRGPDDQGMFVRRGIGLGVRRLSIIDLVSGNQPVHNEDETIWVVFNGEIYNYRELRAELERFGHRFYTQSDTEVIPHLYEQFGTEYVHKLRGMFAIALYDQRQNRLMLARDRLGKKPLVYARHRDRLLFASEMRALLAVEPELAEVDNSALLQHLEVGYIYDPHTAFKKIRKLPPGHILDCRQGQIRVSQFWDVPQFTEDNSKSEQEWLVQLEEEIAAAVRMRLVADVPVGALLSGGVDSSVVVALMARASSKPVKTFSAVFENQEFDEGPHARKVAKRFGTEHYELTMQPAVPETLDRLTRLLEEPFGDSSMVPTYLIARLVREHVKVALSGDGGDELFAGYDHYDSYFRQSRYRIVPAWLGKMFRRWIFPLLPYQTRGRRFLYNVSLPFPEGYIDYISVLPTSREGSLFTDDFMAATAEQESPQSVYLRIYHQAPAEYPLAKLQYLDMKTYLAADILPKVDRMSMAASLETRAPLLDHVVMEQANRVPARLKLNGHEGKYLLKKLAARLGVPADVIYRPKRGFAIPLVHWFRNELNEQLVDLLTDPRTLQRGYFKRSGVERVLDDHMRRGRDRSRELWVLLIFELWHRNFLEPLRKGSLFTSGSSDLLQAPGPFTAPVEAISRAGKSTV
jgi:asparagine synthase (glutamine-hydrolysing)